MRDKESPYWWPQLTDDSWVAQMREDYPEDTENLDDETVRHKYADGCKYADTWDNLSDARADYEELADAFLQLNREHYRLLDLIG